jgi:hypothetical protein
MHCHHDLTLAPLFMLVSVKAAAVLGQPFPKCGTFHCFVPMYQVLDCVEPSSASLETWALCEILGRFVDLRQKAITVIVVVRLFADAPHRFQFLASSSRHRRFRVINFAQSPPERAGMTYQEPLAVGGRRPWRGTAWVHSPLGWRLTMIDFSYATNINIKRFQNLLETSLDEPERQTIQKLLAEEKFKAALQALGPKKE